MCGVQRRMTVGDEEGFESRRACDVTRRDATWQLWLAVLHLWQIHEKLIAILHFILGICGSVQIAWSVISDRF